MKAVRIDETVIKLALQMTPDEAKRLRSMLIEEQRSENVSADDEKLLQVIIDAIRARF